MIAGHLRGCPSAQMAQYAEEKYPPEHHVEV